MPLFGRRTRISAPTLTSMTINGSVVSLTGTQALFPGTQISVRTTGVPYAHGNYMMEVLQHLSEINRRPLGRQLLQALGHAGKNQVVLYGGPNSNQAAGSPMGYVLMRKYHDGTDQNRFTAELQHTVQASTKGRSWIAAKLVDQTLPHWNGGTSPGPFGARGKGLVSAAKAKAQLDDWLAGNSMPDNDEMDILLLVLRTWLRPGPGVGTRINYDPKKTISGGQMRPPPIALVHELMHAYFNATGTQLGREDSIQEANGGRLFELMSCGLRPFDTDTFGENQIRTVWPHAPRMQYP